MRYLATFGLGTLVLLLGDAAQHATGWTSISEFSSYVLGILVARRHLCAASPAKAA